MWKIAVHKHIFTNFRRFSPIFRVSQEICQGSGVLWENHGILTKTRGKYPRFPKVACFHPISPNFACFQASCPPLPKFPHVAQGQWHIMLKVLPCAPTIWSFRAVLSVKIADSVVFMWNYWSKYTHFQAKRLGIVDIFQHWAPEFTNFKSTR